MGAGGGSRWIDLRVIEHAPIVRWGPCLRLFEQPSTAVESRGAPPFSNQSISSLLRLSSLLSRIRSCISSSIAHVPGVVRVKGVHGEMAR